MRIQGGRIGIRLGLFLFNLVMLAAREAGATAVEDSYVAGYAAAVLEREFSVKAATVNVEDGVVTLLADQLPKTERDKIVSAISSIPGVVRVEVSEAEAPAPPAKPGAGAPAPVRRAGGQTEAEATRPAFVFLPKDKLFRPLLADPRWPHFSVSYLRYIDDEELKNVGSTSFGETFPIVRGELPAGRWEFGFQAAVFAIFDMDAESKDLINADYTVGIPLTYRVGGFSMLGRLFHQSSHLGDEFLLRNRVTRVNLSYEQLDLKLSQEFGGWGRIYGGVGYLFDQDPSDLKRWSSQGGAELQSPWALSDVLRPIAAVDVQNREETDWDTDLSVRGGFQLEGSVLASTRLQILAEYFDGHSPNGQFFERKIQSVGFGAHVHF